MRLHTKLRELFHRSEEDVMLNTEISVRIGGLGKTNSRVLRVREPSYQNVRQHAQIIWDAFVETANKPEVFTMLDRWVRDPSSFNMAAVAKFAPLERGFIKLLAAIVGERVSYVEKEMGPLQMIEVLNAYITCLGVQRAREIFFRLRNEWAPTTTQAAGAVDPAQAQSQSSSQRPESGQTKSTDDTGHDKRSAYSTPFSGADSAAMRQTPA